MTDSQEPQPAINIIFDGPPDHHGPRFVEIENDKGESIRIGDWEPDPRPEHEGYWRLRITLADALDQLAPDLKITVALTASKEN